MKSYNSKIDWWLGLPLVYPIFRSIQAIVEGDLIGYLVLFALVLLIIVISKTTNYIINESLSTLTVKSMYFVNNTIEIAKIRKIEKSNSILSAPALSLDRLLVRYNKYDEVYISPKDKQLFVEELLKINPNIEVKL
jgi:Bacterial PH domain